MSEPVVTVTLADGIGTVTINRPNRMNALTREVRLAIVAAFERPPEGARVMVLTGAGPAFCSGQDLTETAGPTMPDFKKVLSEEYEPMLIAIRDCPVPTISAVNGPAAGAGANLALAADVVIAAENAYFAQAFTGIGLIPDAGGTWFLPRQMGTARAMGAMLFGDKIAARQAAEWGMIYEVVPDADFTAHIATRAAKIARGPAVAYRNLRRAMQASDGNSLRAQLSIEAELQDECSRTEDFREAVAAFLAKRPPVFKGR